MLPDRVDDEVALRGPLELVQDFLKRHFGLESPYERPHVFDLVEVVTADNVGDYGDYGAREDARPSAN